MHVYIEKSIILSRTLHCIVTPYTTTLTCVCSQIRTVRTWSTHFLVFIINCWYSWSASNSTTLPSNVCGPTFTPAEANAERNSPVTIVHKCFTCNPLVTMGHYALITHSTAAFTLPYYTFYCPQMQFFLWPSAAVILQEELKRLPPSASIQQFLYTRRASFPRCITARNCCILIKLLH